MRTIRVVRAAKTLTWRESLALSPLLFGERTQTFTAIARQTGIAVSTLMKLLTRLAVECGTRQPLITLDKDAGGEPIAATHDTACPLSQHFYLTRTGRLQYFPLGVRNEACELSPAENWLYWWWRSAIAGGLARASMASAARLSGVSQPATLMATSKLVSLGWLRYGPNNTLVVGEVDVSPFYSAHGRHDRPLAELLARRQQRRLRNPQDGGVLFEGEAFGQAG